MEQFARSVGRDLRQGVRLWWSSPGLSIIALSSLMLSIGAATAVFTFFDVLLLRPLPVRAPEELCAVGPASPSDLDRLPLYVSYPFYKQLRGGSSIRAAHRVEHGPVIRSEPDIEWIHGESSRRACLWQLFPCSRRCRGNRARAVG